MGAMGLLSSGIRGTLRLVYLLAIQAACVRVAPAGKHRPGLYIANVTQRKEKYLAAISEKLDHGQNVLMLLPDYHVVGDHFYRFLVGALGKRVLWYTSTEPKARLETFFRARTEKGCLILGNKSAVLMPIARQGHDHSGATRGG